MSEVYNKGGNTIPIVFVTTADAEKGLAAVPYKKLSADMRKAVKEVRTALEGKDVLGAAPAADEKKPADKPAKDDAPKHDFSTWTNSAGKTITAMPVDIDITEVTFRLPNGKNVKYPLAKLSLESREKLKEYFEGE